ncbi:MAG: ABC transporter permease [Candidatus Woesebacteria bacterium]|nr:MAG: ABC transporter permease [Candidatus Woesebacteria bacterium]
MDINETIRSSFTAILANRLRSFLTILGIVIGVMSVILLVSVVSGLQIYITEQIQGLGSNLMFVIPGKIGGGRGPGGIQANKLLLADSTNLKTKLLGQAEVSAIIQKVGTVKNGNKNDRNVTIAGVESNYTRLITAIKFDQGQFFSQSQADGGRHVAVIGKTVVTKLFNSDPIGKNIDVSGIKYQVVGVIAPRGSTFGIDEDNVVYIPLSSAQRQFGITNPNTIYIAANNPEQVKLVEVRAVQILGKRLSEDDFSIMTQEQTLSTVAQITGVLTIALGGIAAISLLVGGIGVMNIMLVSVTERTREIGLRKALGAKPNDIRNQFLVEAVALSSIGGIVGIILGIFFSTIINHFITTYVPIWSIGLSFGFSMIVGVIFGVAPAISASKLDPIQSLRYE